MLQISWHLYDTDIIEEDVILKWEDEKKDVDSQWLFLIMAILWVCGDLISSRG